MSAAEDFFALTPEDTEIPEGILRDRYKRPCIVPPGETKAQPYTRISTFAGYLDNKSALLAWKARNTALGVARHDDLRRMIAALAYNSPELDGHIEDAVTRVNDKAAWGTAVHSFTEPDASPYVPEEMQADVLSYFDTLTLHGITVEATECFIVNDELRVAGTFDHIYLMPDGRRLVGDKKTGKAKPHAVAVQLACYSGGSLYNPDTHERTPLDVDLTTGLLVHIPKEEGRTEIFEVDLVKGRAAAHLAARVNTWTKDKTVMTPLATPEQTTPTVFTPPWELTA